MYSGHYGQACLRQEHLSSSEEVAHDVHGIHQRAFDDVQWLDILATHTCLLSVHDRKFIDTLWGRGIGRMS